MPYIDPEKRKQHDRERRRKERAAVVEAIDGGDGKNLSDPPPLLPPSPTVADVTGMLAGEINRVRAAGADVVVSARTNGYLANVLLKAMEIGEIEDRLANLETTVANLKK